MSEEITFGGWLKQERNALGLTQDGLAERIGCSRITLQKLEGGDRRPSVQIAHLLADALNIPIDERDAFTLFARAVPGAAPNETQGKPNIVSTRAPWRVVSLNRTNLPVALTSLIGREREINAARKHLLDPQARLLSLTGAPGVGKTRLALQIASDLADHFEDGVYFVDLSTILDPDFVLPTVARVLELKERSDSSAESVLIDYLGKRKMLLLLDNFEQVLDAASGLIRIMQASPWLKVLVTTREALHVRGERRLPVQPLELPDSYHYSGNANADGTPKPDTIGTAKSTYSNPQSAIRALAKCASVELFLERARAISPDFELTAKNAADISEICVRLEGLPLAIELAAAQIAHLTPTDIRAALSARLKLLTGGARDLPARQRTLKSAIGWSYELLDEAEQLVFRSFSVFVGGCTRDGLKAVCDWRNNPSFATSSADSERAQEPHGPPGSLDLDALEVVASLLAKSLLIQQEGADGEPRLWMLESIREYAAQQLNNHDEANKLCLRHALYYLALVEEAEPELLGSEPGKWLARLDRDYGNIRGILDWASEGIANEASGSREQSENNADFTRSSLGLRMAAALWRYWLIRGYYGEGLGYLAKMLSSTKFPADGTETSLGPGYGPLARAKSLLGMGHFLFLRGDYEMARPLLEQSLSLHRELAYKPGIAQALGNLSFIAREVGAFAVAQTYMEQAFLILQELGNKWGIANAFRELGLLALYQEDNARAITLIEQSVDLFRELGQRWGIAYALVSLGVVMQIEGETSAAESLLGQSLLIGWEMGDQQLVAQCLEELASVAASKDNITRAAQLWGAAQSIRETIGVTLSPFEHANHERDIEAARTQALPRSWEEAWAEGYTQPQKYASEEFAKQEKRASV